MQELHIVKTEATEETPSAPLPAPMTRRVLSTPSSSSMITLVALASAAASRVSVIPVGDPILAAPAPDNYWICGTTGPSCPPCAVINVTLIQDSYDILTHNHVLK